MYTFPYSKYTIRNTFQCITDFDEPTFRKKIDT